MTQVSPAVVMSRRQTTVLWLTVSFDTAFYAVLVPLLPHYVREAHLSQLGAGALMAAFGAGTVVGAVPGAVITSRRGARAALVGGLLTASLASAAFGLATDPWALYAARLTQGIASGVIWTGALAWLVTGSPPDQRAEAIGRALGAAVVGQLLGPACGALGDLYGPTALFAGVGTCGALLALAALRLPAPAGQPDRAPVFARVWGSMRERGMRGAIWLVSLPALLIGTLSVIAPLRLSALGLGAGAIAAVWLLAAVLEAALSPALGRWADWRGRDAPTRVVLAAAFACSLGLPWIHSPWLFAGVACAAVLSYGCLWVPAMANLSDHAERLGLGQGAGFAMQSVWAPAQVLGSMVVGGVLAHWIGRPRSSWRSPRHASRPC